VSQRKNFESRYRLVREIIETIALTILMFLVIRFAVQNFRVDGMSMEPTLHDGEFILVNKAAYLFNPPQRGDVIVFEYPRDTQVDYIKRIIAIPGDTISVVGTKVTVDGVTLNEPYVNQADNSNPFGNIINRHVPPGDYFVMGDNRGNSSDSRDWGFVPRQDIIGEATFVYYPFNEGNFGLLANYSSVFAAVHQ
jgi:signal peptidase I